MTIQKGFSKVEVLETCQIPKPTGLGGVIKMVVAEIKPLKFCEVQAWELLVGFMKRATRKIENLQRRNHIHDTRPIMYHGEIEPTKVKMV